MCLLGYLWPKRCEDSRSFRLSYTLVPSRWSYIMTNRYRRMGFIQKEIEIKYLRNFPFRSRLSNDHLFRAYQFP